MKAKSLPKPVQSAGQDAVVRFGHLTGRWRMAPGFLICGAQRCGTTSMYRTLSQHRDILKPNLHKGVHYFDTSYPRGEHWYLGHFPLRATAALHRRRHGVAPLTFESSPYYLFNPLSAERIARDLPGVKIITLLRDPVERAYSAHTHELARGFETEPFERALELEPQRLAGEEARIIADPAYISHAHQHQAYVTRGRYLPQLERMAAAVGRDRFLVLDAEDFFTDPEPVWREAIAFLGLSDRVLPVFERHNARPRSPMPDSLRASLSDGYLDDDERLAAWWGRTPSWRR